MKRGFGTKKTCFYAIFGTSETSGKSGQFEIIRKIASHLENPDSFEIIRKIGNHLEKILTVLKLSTKLAVILENPDSFEFLPLHVLCIY